MAIPALIDSHVHLYDPALLHYSWLRGDPVLDQPSLPERFDTARGHVAVEAMVFVEVAADAGQHVAEAAMVQQLADADPRIAAIVAHAPVERGAAVEDDLTRLLELRSLRGIRRLIQGETDPGTCLEPGFVEGVRRVGRHGLSFDLCIKHWALPFATELARRCPGTAFVLDHIGKPGMAHGLREPWWAGLRDIATLPNVTCKLSGVITEAGPGWAEDGIGPYVAHALECFGCDRMMFGSDWPVSERTHTYADWVGVVDRALVGCGESERRAVFCETARRVYRLK